MSKMFKQKLTPLEKLQILSALDSGYSKVDMARKYGVHPQTIAYISKQKEVLLKKYKQKLQAATKLTDPRATNGDLVLYNWLKDEIEKGNHISEDHLHCKAKELLSSIGALDNDFENIDDWLMEFRLKYDIVKYSPESEDEVLTSDDWKNLVEGYSEDLVYFGGTCALLHSLDLDTYMARVKPEKHISLFFTCSSTGTERKQLLVVGEDPLPDNDSRLKTLPVRYYKGGLPLVNFVTIHNYLSNWNIHLKSQGQHIALILDLPEIFTKTLIFENIKILRPQTGFVRNIMSKISQCLKYYYRQLQISRSLVYNHEREATTFLTNLNLIGMSWRSILPQFIYNLVHPLPKGSLLLNEGSDKAIQRNPSLSEWSRSANLPLNPEAHSLLDDFVACDNQLQSINQDLECNDVAEAISNFEDEGTSGIAAYQAMKRLYTFLQGVGASSTVLDSARSLEDQTEYGAMLEIHQNILENSTNSN